MAKGCEEIVRQDKDLHNSLKIRTLVTKQKTNKLVLSKNSVFKNQRLEKSTFLLLSDFITFLLVDLFWTACKRKYFLGKILRLVQN